MYIEYKNQLDNVHLMFNKSVIILYDWCIKEI